MRLREDPNLVMSLLDGDTYATATHVRLTRGPYSKVVPIGEILPSQNQFDLPSELVAREIRVRAWALGTDGQQGGVPTLLTGSNFKHFVNTSSSNNERIDSGNGRIYLGAITETGTGWTVQYGPSAINTPHSVNILSQELYSPDQEDMLEAVAALIPAFLQSRDANAVAGPALTEGGPLVTIGTAQRLYEVFFTKVNDVYRFPFFAGN